MYFIGLYFNFLVIMNIKITCCSCFIEKCIWFVKTQIDFTLVKFDTELFVKQKREHRFCNGLLSFTEYIVVCLNCFTFQLWNLSIEDIRIFDTTACRFTYNTVVSYGDDFDEDIFIGNNQFLHEIDTLTRAERHEIFKRRVNIADHFFRRPKHQSCFTSLQKYNLDFFCTQCKSIYCKFFEKHLHCFYF